MFLSTMNRVRLSNLLTSQKTLNFLRYANVNTSSQTEGEKKLSDVLKSRFANARLINVKDTSCKYPIDFLFNHCFITDSKRITSLSTVELMCCGKTSSYQLRE